MNRVDLVERAVVEAARKFMAENLRWERGTSRNNYPVLDALQELRDALAAQSRARRALDAGDATRTASTTCMSVVSHGGVTFYCGRPAGHPEPCRFDAGDATRTPMRREAEASTRLDGDTHSCDGDDPNPQRTNSGDAHGEGG